MAILLEGCDGAPVMWGKIGNLVIQRTKRGTMYIRQHVIPANPRTVAQQTNRMAFKAGIDRWRTHEKLVHKEYWDKIAKKHRFRDGYRAFLSSFVMSYQAKIAELSGESPALSWVLNPDNPIEYMASPAKTIREKQNEELILQVLKRRNTAIFASQMDRSIRYLRDRGWLSKIRFGLLPYADESREWEILKPGLVPDP